MIGCDGFAANWPFGWRRNAPPSTRRTHKEEAMIGNIHKKLPIVTEDPVALSSRIIDSGETDESTNRVTQNLTEVADGISIVESFSHIITFQTADGLVCFDSSGSFTGTRALDSLRAWSTERINSLVYTHGHIDHVGGSAAMAADATDRGYAAPEVVGHVAVDPRLDRYEETNGWNLAINRRQFGGISRTAGLSLPSEDQFVPPGTLRPTTTYRQTHDLTVGGTTFELRHDRGETDDHTWAWIPEHNAICAGDLVLWVFPNCGNPQKVQRYPKDWAAALRKMQALNAEWLFGAHGLPVHGKARVHLVLDDLASALESLVVRTLEMMNAGESLDAILHEVTLPDEVLTKPWMMPIYDEPEFVVRNIWRLYGGWWDQNPSHLKPSTNAELGAEIAALAGGANALVARARDLADTGDFRLACHLIEFAASAEPESRDVHGARAEIYQARRNNEFSLMSKGIFAAAANESKAVIEGPDQPTRR